MPRNYLIIFFLFCTIPAAWAQQPRDRVPVSNLRQKYISTNITVVALDSLSIVPGTLLIPGAGSQDYRIDEVRSTLTWISKPARDSVLITYRVFPFKLNASLQRLNFDSIQNYFYAKPFEFNRGYGNQKGPFDFGNVNYNGSFTRGISFGNNQSAVVNSGLNIQLNGYLSDSIEIAAAITDNNIPIQPDGNTQQLNEFDKILLQFRKRDKWELSLGDIDLRQSQSYFLNFYKRLQGASFETKYKISGSTYGKTLVSGAIAKGKFTRNIFNGLEGNQGPYRLQGANGELFFIVLAGTERVWLDGELMERGEDKDYVINYNTAEVTFTPSHLITKDKRIQVEFEYADRNYLNAQFYGAQEFEFGKGSKAWINAFSNSDRRNSPINQTLDDNQKFFLSQVGDSVGKAYYPAIAIDTFSPGKVLYMHRDTVVNGSSYSIYVYSTDPDSARYRLSFADLGLGNGNYVADFNGANGKVYKWIAPLNGVKQGNFEPVTLLIAPKTQQVVSAGVEYALSKTSRLRAEGAMSKLDVNTFSRIDKGNDNGYAFKIGFKDQSKWRNKRSQNLDVISEVGYEYVQDRFRPLERLRNVEFGRDWGLALNPAQETEKIAFAAAELRDRFSNSVRYQITSYNRGSDFKGLRHAISTELNWKGWKLKGQFNMSNVTNSIQKGFFLRPAIDLTKTLKKFKSYQLGFVYSLEHTQIKNKITDTLTAQSFSFDNITAFVRSNQQKENRWSFTYYTRSDAYPVGKSLIKADRSQNFQLLLELFANKKHQFRFNGSYRILSVLRDNITNLKPDKTLIGRAEYFIAELKGFVTGNILYELGTGQEQRRDLAYLEVPAGQGEYIWRDYNGDGVQQLNEFEISQFRDSARYIRIFTPTNQFLKANYNSFNYSLNLNPRALFAGKKLEGAKKFISKFTALSSLQISKKELSKGDVQFDPFKANLSDTSLILINTTYSNAISFNRFSTKWGIDLSNLRSTGRSILTYGLETRRLVDWTGKIRWNITRKIGFDIVGKKGQNILLTPSFSNRNYELETYSAEPRISFIRGTSFRLQFSYKYDNRKNLEPLNAQGYGAERSIINSLITESKYNILNSASINAKFTYSSIDFTGSSFSPASYIMLDGLVPGKNFLWTIDFIKRLSNNIELNVQYEGRRAGETRTVHIGRMSLRALF